MFKTITVKNLVLIGLVPFMFACSKSKFSAVKQAPAPAPVVQTDDDDDSKPYVPPVKHGCKTGKCNHHDDDDDYEEPPIVVKPPCEKPPVYEKPEQPKCNGKCKKPPVIVDIPKPLPKPKPKPIEPDCDDYEYPMPEYDGIKGVSIIAFMDSSGSNIKERPAYLKSLVASYHKKLARNIPVSIAVATGHSRESQYSVMANPGIFYVSDAGEPAVLHFYPGKDNSNAEAALEAKILGMKKDNSVGYSDGGELIVANLYALLKTERLALAQQMKAIGKNNLLQIIFMSDENDICSPGRITSPVVNWKKKGKVVGKAESEEIAFNEGCYGIDASQGPFDRNTNYSDNEYSGHVYEGLVALSNKRPMMLAGYLYTNPDTVPAGTQNEFGNGLVQLVEATGGKNFDLAKLTSNKAIKAAADELTEYTNKNADLYVKFQVKNKKGELINADELDMGHTKVYVGDKEVEVAPEGAVLVAKGRCDAKPVKIKYCRKPKKY